MPLQDIELAVVIIIIYFIIIFKFRLPFFNHELWDDPINGSFINVGSVTVLITILFFLLSLSTELCEDPDTCSALHL